MKTYFLSPALLLMLFFSCYPGQTQTVRAAESGSGIEGVILMGPTHPGPIRKGAEASKPLANTPFAVLSEGKATPIASFTTDEKGHFRVSLPPGHYSVSREGGRRGIGRFGPFAVEVAAGKMTPVQWDCDTGMR